jgi:hypothetical protein
LKEPWPGFPGMSPIAAYLNHPESFDPPDPLDDSDEDDDEEEG